MNNNTILENLGLSKNESTIYLALIELGSSTISKISDKTAIHRPLIYKALPFLEEKKLVTSVMKGKQTRYTAEPPSKLESIFDDFKLQFLNLMPELEDRYSSNSLKPVVRFLEGKEGIRNIYIDIVATLKKGDTFFRYSSAKDLAKAKKYLPKDYEKMRDSKKLERKVIMAQSKKALKKIKLERYIKSLPDESVPFDFNITKIIYGSKVAYIDYNTETATVIENEPTAMFEKSIFESLYKKL
ncbi:MAG: helix-turn-helix domain-containing protein [Patescibacteria group bacterium]